MISTNKLHFTLHDVCKTRLLVHVVLLTPLQLCVLAVVCSYTMYTFGNTNSAPNYYCFRQYGQFVITRLSEPYTFSQLIKPHHFTFNWEIECTHMFV